MKKYLFFLSSSSFFSSTLRMGKKKRGEKKTSTLELVFLLLHSLSLARTSTKQQSAKIKEYDG